jgi:hypothetical protein
LHYVWIYGKIVRRKESERRESLSIVWLHNKKGRKESFNWGPHQNPFHPYMDGKL